MPPANPTGTVLAFPRRDCRAVLADLRHANRDLSDAYADLRRLEECSDAHAEADDRATEAEQRIETLRDELDRKLRFAGVTVEDLRVALAEALI